MIASELVANTTAYQSARRRPSVCRRRSLQAEDIPNAPHGVDHLAHETLVDLLAQAMDEDVDDIGARVEAVVLHVRDDHRLGHDPAGIAQQVLEQGELARAERLDLASLAGRPAC